MSVPEQRQIDHWFAFADKWIPNKLEKIASGRGKQATHLSLSQVYASFARAKFLNGDPIEEVRAEFANAARHVMKSFTMAYDESDPDYQGEGADLSEVSETIGIEGMNWALMSADFKLATEMAGHYRTRPDGDMLSLRSNRYANALALTIRDKRQPALELLAAQFDDYKKKPPKSPAARNYYSLILALYGIVAGEREKFLEGLKLQINFYQGYAQGEGKDTDEEFICDHAVALTILSQQSRRWTGVQDQTLPGGLLLQ
jgi:hypothetical protein